MDNQDKKQEDSFFAKHWIPITSFFSNYLTWIVLMFVIQSITLFILMIKSYDFEEYINIFIMLSFIMTIISMVFGFFGLCAIVKVLSFEKATHEIEYVPISSNDIKKEDDPNYWKNLEKELSKIDQDDDFFPSEREVI